MSSYEMLLDLLLKIPPDEVLFDFLAQCGLPLRFHVVETERRAYEALLIAAAIEHAPSPVRDCIVASMRHVALLADEAGLAALRAVNEAHAYRVNTLHLPDAPAQCALWMYLRHRDLFDAALRLRGLHTQAHESMPLESLRQPLMRPDAMAVDSVCLYEATLLDETTDGEIAIRVPEGNTRLDVLDLLNTWMPTDNPMRHERFRVISAKLRIEFYPEPGQMIGRLVMVVLRARGSNLDDFDAGTREQLETWLHHWRLAPGRDVPAGLTLQSTV